MKVHCFDIKWDTDGQKVDLPKECDIEVCDKDADYLDNAISDYLSDEYGYCVFSCNYSVL